MKIKNVLLLAIFTLSMANSFGGVIFVVTTTQDTRSIAELIGGDDHGSPA